MSGWADRTPSTTERALVETLIKAQQRIGNGRETKADLARIDGCIGLIKTGPHTPGTYHAIGLLGREIEHRNGVWSGVDYLAEWTALAWAVTPGGRSDEVAQTQIGWGYPRPVSMTYAGMQALLMESRPKHTKAKTKTARTEEPS